MKCCIAFFLALCTLSSDSAGQTGTSTKRMLTTDKWKQFFARHPQIGGLQFKQHIPYGTVSLEFIEKKAPVFQSINRYDLSNSGDRYFFKKRFDYLPALDSLYQPYLSRKADYGSVEGRITYDSIVLKIEQHFPKPKNAGEEEDLVFEKVETRVDYEKGLHVLARQLQDSLQGSGVSATDSIVILRGIVEPKGRYTIYKVEAGNENTEYVKTLIRFINRSGPWIPYQACGRKVKAYKQIYLQVHQDGTYTVALD